VLELVTVTSMEQMQQALSVRRRVFIEEQAVPEIEEIDAHDGDPVVVRSAVHVLALLAGAPVATGRLLLPEGNEHAHVGRVAVLAEHRGTGCGSAVMLALHERARERGLYDITLGAQTHAIGFYERLGYVAYGEVFLDAGIEHRWMDLRLGDA